jgi:hypothetical protein
MGLEKIARNVGLGRTSCNSTKPLQRMRVKNFS